MTTGGPSHCHLLNSKKLFDLISIRTYITSLFTFSFLLLKETENMKLSLPLLATLADVSLAKLEGKRGFGLDSFLINGFDPEPHNYTNLVSYKVLRRISGEKRRLYCVYVTCYKMWLSRRYKFKFEPSPKLFTLKLVMVGSGWMGKKRGCCLVQSTIFVFPIRTQGSTNFTHKFLLISRKLFYE